MAGNLNSGCSYLITAVQDNGLLAYPEIIPPQCAVEESQSLVVLDYVINFYDTRFQIRYIFCDFLNFECYFYPSSFYRGESQYNYHDNKLLAPVDCFAELV